MASFYAGLLEYAVKSSSRNILPLVSTRCYHNRLGLRLITINLMATSRAMVLPAIVLAHAKQLTIVHNRILQRIGPSLKSHQKSGASVLSPIPISFKHLRSRSGHVHVAVGLSPFQREVTAGEMGENGS